MLVAIAVARLMITLAGRLTDLGWNFGWRRMRVEAQLGFLVSGFELFGWLAGWLAGSAAG